MQRFASRKASRPPRSPSDSHGSSERRPTSQDEQPLAEERAPRSRSGARAAIVIGIVYLGVQLFLFRLKPGIVYDEAVYLSQIVRPRHPIWGPHRAWGTVLLIAPVAVFGIHIGVLRLYLAIASSALLAWAYWLWFDLIGPAAIGAAVAFGVSWVALYFGTQAFPNLPLALFSVAAVAFAIKAMRGHPKASRGAVFCVAACALIRPSDATALVAGIALALLIVHRARCARALAALVVGLALGWLPWVVESFIVFGGPFRRLKDAAVGNATVALRDNLGAYIRSFGGPLLNRVPMKGFPVWASIVPLSLIALAVIACVRFARHRDIDGYLACMFAASAMAVTYLFFSGATAPRFLLPTYALLAVPAAALFFDLNERLLGGRKVLAIAVSACLVVPLLGWNAARAHTIWRDQVSASASSAELARNVASAANGAQCVVAGPFGIAEISVQSHCGPWNRSCPEELAELRRRHILIEGIAPESRSWDAEFSTWTRLRTFVVGKSRWQLYELRPSDAFTPPPDVPPCVM